MAIRSRLIIGSGNGGKILEQSLEALPEIRGLCKILRAAFQAILSHWSCQKHLIVLVISGNDHGLSILG